MTVHGGRMKKFLSKYYIHIIFLAYFFACLIRATRGFCWSDESFYFSTTDRFFKGDIPMVDEWWRTQMSSVFCLPFYSLFYLITGTNAGVILYFRVLYVITSMTLAIVGFRIISKKYPKYVALSISTLITFYAHLNIATYSYYTLSVVFFLFALFLLYDYYDTKSKVELIMAGTTFAIAVMALPSLVLAYFIVIIVALIAEVISKLSVIPEKIRERIKTLDIITVILYTTAGIIIPALLFMLYMLCNTSLSDIINAIPYVMTDKEHDFTYVSAIKKFFTAVRDVYGRYTYVSCLLVAVGIFIRKVFNKKICIYLFFLTDILLFFVLAAKSYPHTGYIQTAICLSLIPLYFASEKKNKGFFWLFTIGGAILAMTYSISSNNQLYILTIGHFVIAVACICSLYDFVSSFEIDNRIIRQSVIILSSLAVVLACGITVYLRMVNVYRDSEIHNLNVKITEGPAKGLYTTSDHYSDYYDVYDTINEYCTSANNGPDTKIMFSKILPWGYMVSDLHCALPTTWRTISYTSDQFESYYEEEGHSKPDLILVLDEKYGSFDACGDVEDDHNPNLNELDSYWNDYINDNMTGEKVRCGMLYKFK